MIELVCAGIAIALASGALFVALFTHRACSRSSQVRRISSLETAYNEVLEMLGDLRASQKRAYARDKMREIRAARREAAVETPEPAADPAEARASAKETTRKLLKVPNNPVAAVLANLRGEIGRERD